MQVRSANLASWTILSRRKCLMDALIGLISTLACCNFSVPVTAADCQAVSIETEVSRGTPASIRLASRAHVLREGTYGLAIGDSIAGRWPQAQLDQSLGGPVEKFAIGGDRLENTTWLVGQFDGNAAAGVKVVLSTTGAANLLNYDPCDFEADSRALFQKLRMRFSSAKIYVTNIYQKGERGQARMPEVTSANEILQSLATEYRFRYVDAHEAIGRECMGVEICPLLEANRVHPNEAGFQALSSALRSVFEGSQ